MFSSTALAAILTIVVAGVPGGASRDAGQTPPVPAGAIVVASDGSGDHETIAAAIAAAADGDTVLVRGGTYAGPIVIDKDVDLVGENTSGDVVLTATDGPILHLMESDALIRDLAFHGPTSDGVLVDGGSPRLERLRFDAVGHPWGPGRRCDGPCDSITIRAGSTAVVRDSSFVAAGGIRVADSAPVLEGNELMAGPAILLWNVRDDAMVRGNTITGALGNAISVYGGAARPRIQDNVVLDAGASGISVGLVRFSRLQPIVRGNTVSGATNGITVSWGQPSIADNLLFGNVSAIVVAWAQPVVTGNEIRDNGSGVFVMFGAATLEDNVISGGHVGLGVGTRLARLSLEGNRITANETDIELMFGAPMPALAGNVVGPPALGDPVSR